MTGNNYRKLAVVTSECITLLDMFLGGGIFGHTMQTLSQPIPSHMGLLTGQWTRLRFLDTP